MSLVILLATLAGAQNASVQFSNEFTLSWQFQGDSIEFEIQCGLLGYCSFGFGKDMDDVDMIAIFSTGGDMLLWDLWSIGDVTPLLDTTQGGSDDLVLVSS